MASKSYNQYEFIDNGSGLRFHWVSSGELSTETHHDVMRTLLRRVFIEEKLTGSREVIELARKITKQSESSLHFLFGRGSDCCMIGKEVITSEAHLNWHYADESKKFVHALRTYLLGVVYDKDVFSPDVKAIDVTDNRALLTSNSILGSFYRQATAVELTGKAIHPLTSGFIQCCYTGRCWMFYTRRLSTFNAVLSRRLGASRQQFRIWIEQSNLKELEARGKVRNWVPGTVALLKNKKLFESEERVNLELCYKIPA